jgi:hypothetical protein
MAMVKNGYSLDPNWVTGFTDAEGSFTISIYKNKIHDKTKWRVQAYFQIELHIRDLIYFYKLNLFLIIQVIFILIIIKVQFIQFVLLILSWIMLFLILKSIL